MKVKLGRPFPLGATYDGSGTNFALFSEIAERVELCLFDEAGVETRVDLPEVTAFCWHGFLVGVEPGQRYGYRVHGPWDPPNGLRCHSSKLLLDPYATAVEGGVVWDEAVFPYRFGRPDGPPNESDSAPYVPRSVVTRPQFDWGEDRAPRTSWSVTVVYELHVKGFTVANPLVPAELRGTYAALGTPTVIDHLHSLGVTAVELMPVHQFIHDHGLARRGLSNYWGYNSIAYLAPHNEFSSSHRRGGVVDEFKQMVKSLHAAGIEVILDVVYNHTAEGNHLGPVCSLKGIDNPAYYRLMRDDRRFYMDYTGTGNTLNMRHPHVLQLIMDSLRYWVTEMHVDGFRFDLAAALARELHDVDRLSAFFDLIHQDPVVSRVKLIAEPWDVGEGGYQIGNFPPLWSEWNDKYRDTIRDYWRGQQATLGEFAYRFTGSSDLYQSNGRRPSASINFVTAHDGFTLADLVSYNTKHNEANGDFNRDGSDDNRSWNCGAEGFTADTKIQTLRNRQRRNLLTTLLLSQGVPMLLAGDELGRSQNGNNNAYCQDNRISWLDWDHVDEDLLALTRWLTQFRRAHPVFRRHRWFQGRPIHGSAVSDIGWFTPAGEEMSELHWESGFAKSLAIFLNGDAIADQDANGDRVADDSFYLLFNGHHGRLDFSLPDQLWGAGWKKILDTNQPRPVTRKKLHAPGQRLRAAARSVVVLQAGRGRDP